MVQVISLVRHQIGSFLDSLCQLEQLVMKKVTLRGMKRLSNLKPSMASLTQSNSVPMDVLALPQLPSRDCEIPSL